MKLNNMMLSYVAALIALFIWSVTFVSTKVLLVVLSPTEILVYRYIIAYLLFVIIEPKFLKPQNIHDEWTFALAGLFGITLYFLCENFALCFSTASNVSMIVASSPMLTGLLAHFTTNNYKMTKSFLLGCVLGLSGVFLLVFNGHFILKLNPIGDILAFGAALSFAIYSIIIKDINKTKYSAIIITRKTFFYALLTLFPLCFTTLFSWQPSVLMHPKIMANVLFLGIFASAVCFLLWNKVIWNLGAVKANNLIYLLPPMSLLAASLLLHERITIFAIAGGLLILAGVYVSQRQS